jgi:hypothetical protein
LLGSLHGLFMLVHGSPPPGSADELYPIYL